MDDDNGKDGARWRLRWQQQPFNSYENTKINWLKRIRLPIGAYGPLQLSSLSRNDFSFFAVTSYGVHDGNECKSVYLQFKVQFSIIRKAHILCVRFVGGVSMARHTPHKCEIWRCALGIWKQKTSSKRGKAASYVSKQVCIRYDFGRINFENFTEGALCVMSIIAISFLLIFFSVGHVASISLAPPRRSNDCFQSLLCIGPDPLVRCA